MRRRGGGIVLALVLTACGGGRRAAERPGPARVSGASGTIIFPERMERGERYPVIVMLPASNGTAQAMVRDYPPRGDVIVVVSAGTGSGNDYRTNAAWAATIERYERALRADLRALEATGRADMDRVVLAGFSMGGDLAWALALRNPDLVRGSIVMGSRMSYRASGEAHARLRRRGVRFYLIMGSEEERSRAAGARAAAALLDELDVDHRYREVRGLTHLRAPAGVFNDALEFVLRD